MAERPTTGELYKTKSVTEADLVAAVDASKFAVDMLADPGIKDASKRSAVRTAIMLARPVRG